MNRPSASDADRAIRLRNAADRGQELALEDQRWLRALRRKYPEWYDDTEPDTVLAEVSGTPEAGQLAVFASDSSIEGSGVSCEDGVVSADGLTVADSATGYAVSITASLTANRAQVLPDKAGTFAMLSDVTGGSNVSLAASITDFLSLSTQTIGAVSAGADKLVFWDDSAGKATYLTLGANLSITGTTINVAGGVGTGDVVGPGSATDEAIARFDLTTGKLIQNSSATLDDSGNISTTGSITTGTLRVKGSSTGVTAVTSANAGASNYTATLQAANGTIAYLSNITGTNSGTNTGDVSLNASLTDILGLSSQALSAVDAGSDKLIFWDDSANKTTYLTLGSNLSITGTTINVTGGAGDALTANSLDQFADVTQTAGKTLSITDNTTLSGGTHSGTNTGDASLGASVTDVLALTGQAVSAVDGGVADKIVFWDDSANKLTYLALGTNISITGTTVNVSAGDALTSASLDQFADVTQTAGKTLSITDNTTLSGGTHSGTNTGDVTFGLSVTDIIALTGQAVSAVDAGSDKLIFWDDSAGKSTYLTLGSNLSITGTTINAAGGGDAVTTGTLDQFADVTQTAGKTLSITDNTTLSGGTHSGTNTGDASLGASVTDVLALTGQAVSAVDGGVADKIVFWDDSANKLTYLGLGSNISITGTTVNVSAGDALTSASLDQFADVTQTAGKTLSITDNTTLSGGTHSGTNTGDASLAASVTDVLALTGQAVSAVDGGVADMIVFWDDSANKLTYLSLGTNISITGTTLNVTGGAGTVTHTGGALTANSVVLGAGTDDTKVVAGIVTDGTSKVTLGVAGASVGAVAFNNATSGTITVQPVTGALGTVTLSLPASTGTFCVHSSGTNADITTTTGLNTIKHVDAGFVEVKNATGTYSRFNVAGGSGSTLAFTNTSVDEFCLYADNVNNILYFQQGSGGTTAGTYQDTGWAFHVSGTQVASFTSAGLTLATDKPIVFAGTGAQVTRSNLGLDTADSPQFTAVNIGHATDTTITRVSAGNIAVEGNAIYRAGGTDVPVADGGTGASDAATARSNLGVAATLYKSGGSDAIKLDELAAPTDVTTLDASTSAHGLLKKLPNDATQLLDGTGSWTVTGWNLVRKTADESVNSGTTGTTMQNDDHLFFTTASGTAYEIELVIIYTSAVGAGTPDIKIDLGEDSTIRGTVMTTSLTTADALQNVGLLCNQTATVAAGTSAANRAIVCKGWFVGAGGTFRLRWAQNTSNANNTTVKTGSMLRYRAIS